MVVVVSGTSLIGPHIVENPNAHEHDATPAAPRTGSNAVTAGGIDACATANGG